MAFESDIRTCEILKQNLSLLPQKMRDKVKVINETLSGTTIMKKYTDEKITLINADVEGYELEFLKSIKDIIINDRPVLSICAYHKKEDIIEIPQYIENITNDYFFYCRKYESTVRDVNHIYELVIYGIPKERLVE